MRFIRGNKLQLTQVQLLLFFRLKRVQNNQFTHSSKKERKNYKINKEENTERKQRKLLIKGKK